MSTGLPLEYARYAANLARWFPEVLIALGAPDVEDCYVPMSSDVVSRPGGGSLEVVLERRSPPSIASTALPGSAQAQAQMFRSIGHHANDFEAYAAMLAALNPPARAAESRESPLVLHQPESVEKRLAAAASEMASQLEQVLAIGQLQAAQVRSAQKRPTAGRGNDETSPGAEQPSHVEPAAAEKILSPQHARIPDNMPTPRRGRQREVRQGDRDNTQRYAGRSRNQLAKAAEWRSQRESLKIAITKVPKLQEEPMSPKFVKSPSRVWGPSRRMRSVPGYEEDRSAAAVKQRIEQKLIKMFGETARLSRHSSLQEPILDPGLVEDPDV